MKENRRPSPFMILDNQDGAAYFVVSMFMAMAIATFLALNLNSDNLIRVIGKQKKSVLAGQKLDSMGVSSVKGFMQSLANLDGKKEAEYKDQLKELEEKYLCVEYNETHSEFSVGTVLKGTCTKKRYNYKPLFDPQGGDFSYIRNYVFSIYNPTKKAQTTTKYLIKNKARPTFTQHNLVQGCGDLNKAPFAIMDQYQMIPGTSSYYTNIFSHPDGIYAVGKGKEPNGESKAIMRRSHDGGFTWKTLDMTELSSSATVHDDKAFSLVYSRGNIYTSHFGYNNSNQMHVYVKKSTDGGSTWSTIWDGHISSSSKKVTSGAYLTVEPNSDDVYMVSQERVNSDDDSKMVIRKLNHATDQMEEVEPGGFIDFPASEVQVNGRRIRAWSEGITAIPDGAGNHQILVGGEHSKTLSHDGFHLYVRAGTNDDNTNFGMEYFDDYTSSSSPYRWAPDYPSSDIDGWGRVIWHDPHNSARLSAILGQNMVVNWFVGRREVAASDRLFYWFTFRNIARANGTEVLDQTKWLEVDHFNYQGNPPPGSDLDQVGWSVVSNPIAETSGQHALYVAGSAETLGPGGVTLKNAVIRWHTSPLSNNQNDFDNNDWGTFQYQDDPVQNSWFRGIAFHGNSLFASGHMKDSNGQSYAVVFRFQCNPVP